MSLPFIPGKSIRRSAATNDALMFTFDASASLVVPMRDTGTSVNGSIDWGDGTSSTITAFNDVDLTKSYGSGGTKTVTITGVMPHIAFGDNDATADRILTVENMGDLGYESFENMFQGSALTSFTAGDVVSTGVTSCLTMLAQCSSLTNADVTGLVSSSCLNLKDMFVFNTVLDTITGLDTWDTSGVTTIESSFRAVGSASLSLAGLSSWDTSAVSSWAFAFRDTAATDIPLASFRHDATTSFPGFLSTAAQDTVEYSNALIAYNANMIAGNGNSSTTLDVGTTTYNSSASSARANLISTYLWNITDGGLV